MGTATFTPGLEQRMTALARANAVRLERVRLHREVRALAECEGRERLAELLSDPPEALLNLPVEDAVQWVARFGPSRARPIVAAAGVVGSRSLGQLTERQRRVIAGALRETGGAR